MAAAAAGARANINGVWRNISIMAGSINGAYGRNYCLRQRIGIASGVAARRNQNSKQNKIWRDMAAASGIRKAGSSWRQRNSRIQIATHRNNKAASA